METGARVWLRSPLSQWGWLPARITQKEEITTRGKIMVRLTLVDDCGRRNGGDNDEFGDYFDQVPPFEVTISMDPASLKNADHDDVKLRNVTSKEDSGGNASAVLSRVNDEPIGLVHDLIHLTHLHEPAILHSLRLRYDGDVIYTSTGPILIAINPFKRMDDLYGEQVMERYRIIGEGGMNSTTTRSANVTPVEPSRQSEFKRFGESPSTRSLYTKTLKKSDNSKKLWGNIPSSGSDSTRTLPPRNDETKSNPQQKRQSSDKLPPHAYKTADDAYRAMMRGLENRVLMGNAAKREDGKNGNRELQGSGDHGSNAVPTNQSILVSGESGAGKTVTTKIVLNYFAMLSKKITTTHSEECTRRRQSFSPRTAAEGEEVCIEQQVLQSNPILEAFGNARTLRNDNSSRFGKYIDIHFTNKGKLSGAKIETYLLEKVRLIHPSEGERNYHVFYQFLARASAEERRAYMLDEKTVMSPRYSNGIRGGYGRPKIGVEDFKLLNQTGTYDRRDKVSDGKMHDEMLEAMLTIGFDPDTIHSLMRLVAAILHCGNMTFTSTERKDYRGHSDACHLDKTPSAMAAAKLLGVTFEDLAEALTTRAIRAGNEIVHTPMDMTQSKKACEALMKATYGASFDFIVAKVNESISSYPSEPQAKNYSSASIGVLDIFGFETFESNNFEQICINYTNEALQQQFNKYVFKLEQDEYEREGILWKFISFPDNQEILDLIDKKHTGILAVLDEQCIVPSTDQKFTRFLYAKCDKHPRFTASAGQRVHHKFTIEHYAGPVEYSTDNWLEKNKDQMPSASVDLLRGSNFDLLSHIQQYIRAEREGRGSIATKSVAAQFCSQLRELRSRIDTTVPHYIRCLKPNDELVPDRFDPKMIVDQLRCGGVLEAVRVSRAGYPTRYPHDVFKARYYFLGDSEVKRNKTLKTVTPFGKKVSTTNGDESIKNLISKIAFDIWEAEHASKERQESPLPAKVSLCC
eukprot:CCRYP_006620-RA/>CCRYP_006620-RA protein AED:0.11 eAED:0.11 QI:212/1/1/1/0.77/0.9/10/1132/973